MDKNCYFSDIYIFLNNCVSQKTEEHTGRPEQQYRAGILQSGQHIKTDPVGRRQIPSAAGGYFRDERENSEIRETLD